MKHGGFGFHPIWINIDQFFDSQHIEAIKKDIQHTTQKNIQSYQKKHPEQIFIQNAKY